MTDIPTIAAGQADRIAELEAENARLRDALLMHNDCVRSAASIAGRNGEATNWLSFRGQVHYTLAEYHDIVNAARAALGDKQ